MTTKNQDRPVYLQINLQVNRGQVVKPIQSYN